MPLITLTNIDNFDRTKDVPPKSVDRSAIVTVRGLHETEELEPWIQAILFDTNETPHGPSEIADIFTHKLTKDGAPGLAAFILKGRSFPTVRPKHVSHQIYRLEKIPDLRYAVFAASGNVLDTAKEQFVSTCKRLNVDYCIFDAHDLARLFVAFGFLCPRDGEKIKGGRCSCGFSPKNRTSNILQKDALSELKIAHNLGQPTGAIVLPTGAGKTRVAVIDILRQNSKLAVYTAHSHEILEGAEAEFLKEFPNDQVCRFSDRPVAEKLKRINLISIQSLSRNLSVFDQFDVDYLVVDEFHHAAASSYRKSIDSLNPEFLLGLTATPFRGDQQDVMKLCKDNVLVDYGLRDGIDFGVLCPYHYFGCFDDVDYSNIRRNGTRYDVRDLERALIIAERDEAIIRKWREKADRKSTLAFCCTHAHARRVCQSFNSAGIPCEVYFSETSQTERNQLRNRLRSSDLKVLCVVDVLNEGIDLPFVECLLFLRPTDSKRIFLQQMGRGLRWFVGKKFCTIIDFIGNFQNAYKIVEHLELEPLEEGDFSSAAASNKSAKEILNLPAGCEIEFDEKVINIFGDQTNNFAYATRQNISKMLIYQYRKVEKRLGRKPQKIDIDRSCVVGSRFYVRVFRSWREFERIIDN